MPEQRSPSAALASAARRDAGPLRPPDPSGELGEVKRAEEALRESEQRYRSLFTHMSEGFALGELLCGDDGTPRDLRILEMNDAVERQTGLKRAQVLGRPLRELLPDLEREWIEALARVALTGEPARFESYSRDLDRHFAVNAFCPARGQFAVIFSDITERKRTDEALRRSEAQLRVATLAAEIGVWSWVPGTSEVSVSANWRRLFGVAPEARVTLETWRDALHPDDRDRAVRELNEASDAHREFDTEYRVVWPDGTVRWMVDRGRASYDASGQAVSMGGVNVDITDRKRAEETLREADRRKDEFLGMLSHELRRPLAPICNSLYILEHADAGGEQAARARAVIQRQTQHLTRLVDDLLDVTRIARGKVELRRERIDLREIVWRAAEDLRPVIESRGVRFTVSVPDEPVPAIADATRLTQVTGNLLHNAAKYTRTGDEVSLSLRAAGADAQLRVRDTGAGIDPALLTRLFQPFVQVERTLARAEGGLGLGLALVKGLAELHGGSVQAESAGKGRGAEFVVRLPLAAPSPVDAAPSPEAPAGRRSRRVLVVDDDRDAAESLLQVVEVLGHLGDVASDGPSAVAKARASRFDVVLCDLGLPGMSGYEVAQTLRREGGTMRLVAVSGYAQAEDVQRSAAAGFDGHLAKPCDPEDIDRLLLG